MPQKRSERLAIFESEGVSTEVMCEYFGCDEDSLARLREGRDA